MIDLTTLKKRQPNRPPTRKKKGETSPPAANYKAANKQGRDPATDEKETTETGTETHHQGPQARTAQNGKPKREQANPANDSAAPAEENQTTATHREKERREGRNPKNEPPPTEANPATTPGTGAGQPTGETETEKTATGHNRQTQRILSHPSHLSSFFARTPRQWGSAMGVWGFPPNK